MFFFFVYPLTIAIRIFCYSASTGGGSVLLLQLSGVVVGFWAAVWVQLFYELSGKGRSEGGEVLI